MEVEDVEELRLWAHNTDSMIELDDFVKSLTSIIFSEVVESTKWLEGDYGNMVMNTFELDYLLKRIYRSRNGKSCTIRENSQITCSRVVTSTLS